MIQAFETSGEPSYGVAPTAAIDTVSQLALRVADAWRVPEIDMVAATASSVRACRRNALGCDGPPLGGDLVFDVDIEHIDAGHLAGGDTDQTASTTDAKAARFQRNLGLRPGSHFRLGTLAWSGLSIPTRTGIPGARLRARFMASCATSEVLMTSTPKIFARLARIARSLRSASSITLSA